MEPVPIVLSLLVLLGLWGRFLHATSAGRASSPLWGAFTATAVAILFVVAGTVGYKLDHGVPFTISTAWSGRVLWSEIWVGAGAALVAVYLWRVGLRSLRTSR
jgi:hypothetical protein